MQIEQRWIGRKIAYVVRQNGEILGRAPYFYEALEGKVTPLSSDDELGELCVPTTTSTIACIGLNYRRHAEEMGKTLPEAPLMFLKPTSAMITSGQDIVLPPQSQEVHYEGELAVVIGRTTKNVTEATALDHVAGYTLINDVTARDLQRKDVQYTRAKSFDTFAPIGPAIATDLDPQSLIITTRVNGEVRQQSPTSDMIFGVAELVAYVSSVMTLRTGDVIATGTPPGVGALHAGDVVEVEVEEIGVLRNTVR